MYIRVAADFAVTLEEPRDLKRFKLVVEAERNALPRLRAALAEAAVSVDEETAWIHEAWLRRQIGLDTDASWQDGVSAMIATARRFGWIDEATATIKAHVDWAAPGGHG